MERARQRKAINPRVYTVKAGDSLYGIAEKRGLWVGDLARFNDLPAGPRG